MVNIWWARDAAERYWMEITDRRDVGSDLNAPQRDGVGNESWTYSLVTCTQPGDVVFHWHTDWFDRSAIIGWSEVIGPLQEVDPYTWQARGTRGRARGVPTVGRGWKMPSANFNELERPIDAARLIDVKDQLFSVADRLREQHGATYFPFIRYGNGVRAAQAYLTKFPASLISLLPELGQAMVRDGASLPLAAKSRRGAGRLQDPALRKAIEEHAVARAMKHYRARGATGIEVLGKPFDLLVRTRTEEIHVEVKGSALSLERIVLTANEVTHARSFTRTDLFVVDQIHYRPCDNGVYATAGGRDRIWENWSPQDADLSAVHYQYTLQDSTVSLV